MTTKLIVLACLLAVANARSVNDFNFSISTLTSRILGGHNAEPGQFPHQISLLFKNPEEGIIYFKHFCGGSILNKRWILTAAHCLVLLEDQDPGITFVVKAGKNDLNSTEGSEQISLIESFVIHEKYDRKPKYNAGPYDIGLIKLKNPLRMNKRVAPIRLPKRDAEPTGTVTLSGWGAVDDAIVDPKMPAILQTIDFQILDRESCNEAVHTLFEQAGQPLPAELDLVDRTNICTGPMTGGISGCGGDSGGPLISKDSDGKVELVGVVSWGVKPCGLEGAPSVYVRTSFFIDWIQNIMSKE